MDLPQSLLELVDEDEAFEASETPPAEVDEHIGKETSSRTPGLDVFTLAFGEKLRIPVRIVYSRLCVKHSGLPIVRLILRTVTGFWREITHEETARRE